MEQVHHKVAEFHRLEAERHPVNSTKGAKSSLDSTDQAVPEAFPTDVPVATDDFDAAFDAELPSAAAGSLGTAGQAPLSSPTVPPEVPATGAATGETTDDLEAGFDAGLLTGAATGAKHPSVGSGGGAAKTITPESARALMRRKEVAAPQHIERGRVVRALRATAIAEARQRGTWHSNPAVLTSPPSTKEKKKTVRRV